MRYYIPICQTVFLFSLLVWIYVVMVQITHPNWLQYPMARYAIPPFNIRVDDAGVLSFALAAISFLLWRSEVDESRPVGA